MNLSCLFSAASPHTCGLSSLSGPFRDSPIQYHFLLPSSGNKKPPPAGLSPPRGAVRGTTLIYRSAVRRSPQKKPSSLTDKGASSRGTTLHLWLPPLTRDTSGPTPFSPEAHGRHTVTSVPVPTNPGSLHLPSAAYSRSMLLYVPHYNHRLRPCQPGKSSFPPADKFSLTPL